MQDLEAPTPISRAVVGDAPTTVTPAYPDAAQARAGLAALAGDDPAEFADLLAIVVDSFADSVARLSAAAAAGDRKQVHFHGHALKGSTRTAGMTDLAALAEVVEVGADSLDEPDLRTRVDELAARVGAAIRELSG